MSMDMEGWAWGGGGGGDDWSTWKQECFYVPIDINHMKASCFCVLFELSGRKPPESKR